MQQATCVPRGALDWEVLNQKNWDPFGRASCNRWPANELADAPKNVRMQNSKNFEY
jgi:hypothetical protein